MENTTNDKASPGENRTGHATTNAPSVMPSFLHAMAEPMHATLPAATIAARERVMRGALVAACPEDKAAAILSALIRGFPIIGAGRAADALAAAGFVWPQSAPARCLGPITRAVARRGLIVPKGITKGLTKRSHAGRVNWWRWVGEAS
jgi:hypothetical protein